MHVINRKFELPRPNLQVRNRKSDVASLKPQVRNRKSETATLVSKLSQAHRELNCVQQPLPSALVFAPSDFRADPTCDSTKGSVILKWTLPAMRSLCASSMPPLCARVTRPDAVRYIHHNTPGVLLGHDLACTRARICELSNCRACTVHMRLELHTWTPHWRQHQTRPT